MKKLNYIIITIVFLFTGCTEYLTLEPQDELIREEYWKTESDVVSVIGATYGKMTNILSEIYYWSELRGGLFSPDEKRVESITLEFFNFNINEYNEWVVWDYFYEVINMANTLIEYAPLAKENDRTFTETAFNGYIAEAYFIRSLCYFYLVKVYRDVPLILKSYSTDDQDFSIEKTSENEIIEQLINDLNNITDKAFKPDYFTAIEEKKGRVNINAVYALLADIYLWNNDYENCIATCNKISDIYLVDGENYFSIYANDGNSLESILELQYDYSEYQTINTLYYLTSNHSQGRKELVVSEYLMGLYSSNDLRQHNQKGEVTYNSDIFSLWKYEGNAPYQATSSVVHRTKITSDANWIFYRLADIILMKAEAYAEMDDFTNALEQLNMIKERANIDLYTDNTNKKKLLNEILDERARELVGEGKRWFDLVRITRRDKDNRLNFISSAVIPNVDPRSRSAVESKIKDMNSWFLPIYYNELLLNKKLEQNPFYK